MGAFGLTRTDVAAQSEVDVWPDNWESATFFVSLGTQWRVGFSGRTGMDYGVLPAVLRLQGIPRSRWAQLFEDLRVMEAEALETMREDE